jgi:hypothetical protein
MRQRAENDVSLMPRLRWRVVLVGAPESVIRLPYRMLEGWSQTLDESG